jgi:hypothetical protein
MTNRKNSRETNDDLEQIEGVGPGYADALRQAGVQTFADLAHFASPEALHAVLLESAEADVPLWKIERNDWIGQARKKVAAKVVTKRSAAEAEAAVADAGPESEEAPSPEEWQEHAVFMVFFERRAGEEGQEMWQTRTYRSENDGEVAAFPGVEPSPWVEWILNNAHLPFVVPSPTLAERPAAAEEAVTVTEAGAPAAEGFAVTIQNVSVSEVGPTADAPEKGLGAEVQFEVSWPPAVIEPPAHYRVEIHTVDLESGDTALLASEGGHLESEVHSYHSHQRFPIPEIGRYRLHYVVLLLPPAGAVAFHDGPTLNVRP